MTCLILKTRFDRRIHHWYTIAVVSGIGNCEAASLAGLHIISPRRARGPALTRGGAAMSARCVCQWFSFVVLLIILSLLLPASNPPAVAQQPQTAPAPAFRSSSVMFIENVGQSWMPSPIRSDLVAPNVSSTGECRHWSLVSDIRTAPYQENPNRDSCGTANVWYFMRSASLNRNPASYSLLPGFNSTVCGRVGLQAWQ